MPPMNANEKALCRAKNKKVMDNLPTGRFAVRTRHGDVAIESMTTKTDTDGAEYLDIHLTGDTQSGEGHWKIYNPPTWVRDPGGPFIGRDGKTRFREDPVMAVAEAIASRGGRRQKSKRPL